jgi:hypothetical protein
MNDEAYLRNLRRLGVEPTLNAAMPTPATADPIVILTRAQAFRRQVDAWVATGRVGVPVLALPDTPPPQAGRCVSCAATLGPDRTWRCPVCVRAVEIALAPRGSDA